MSLGRLILEKVTANFGLDLLMLDTPDTILKKIKRAVTDSENRIYYDKTKKPGVSNLISILSASSKMTIKEIEKCYESATSYAALKDDTYEAVIKKIKPIQEAYHQIRADHSYLKSVLANGASLAREKAGKKITIIKEILGFV